MPPFAGTDLIYFVLAVATTMIAQGPRTKAKVSWVHLLPRAGPETFFHRGRTRNILSTEAGERSGKPCLIAQDFLSSLLWSPTPWPDSIYHWAWQSCLKSPLRQGAWWHIGHHAFPILSPISTTCWSRM